MTEEQLLKKMENEILSFRHYSMQNEKQKKHYSSYHVNMCIALILNRHGDNYGSRLSRKMALHHLKQYHKQSAPNMEGL